MQISIRVQQKKYKYQYVSEAVLILSIFHVTLTCP